MSKDYIEKMLKDLCQYSEVEITHTISKNKKPIVSVNCFKNTFKLTFIENQSAEIYHNIEDTVLALHNVLNKTLEESTN
ncbi:hypothetical protein V7654_21805 [Bacillus sp. JJ1609]|uniref:hypothetical protein n=1 Tax=Bacillus sp. JJ1609 TaxID=3122977 RepID=UPI002FFDDE18